MGRSRNSSTLMQSTFTLSVVALKNSFSLYQYRLYQYRNGKFSHNWGIRRNYKNLPSTDICRITVCNLAVSWPRNSASPARARLEAPVGRILLDCANFCCLQRIDARRRALKNPDYSSSCRIGSGETNGSAARAVRKLLKGALPLLETSEQRKPGPGLRRHDTERLAPRGGRIPISTHPRR